MTGSFIELYASVSTPTIGTDIYEQSYGFDKTFAYLDPKLTDATRDKFEYLNKFLTEQGLIQNEVDIDVLLDESYYK